MEEIGILFSVKLSPKLYSDNEVISEIAATLKMEGMEPDAGDIKILEAIKNKQMTASDARAAILSEV